MKILVGVVVFVAVIILWSAWGYFSSRVEQMRYTVVRKADGYEIREYPAHIVAQTTVQGSYDEALNQGFRIVAGYIFGGNAKKESIAMTAPVTTNISGNSHTISFGMPSSYTLATLPVPSDSRVKLVEVLDMKIAAVTFSWWRTDARIQAKTDTLLAALKRDKVQVLGAPEYAGYNAPWTPPWMNRNEILVQVQ